MKEYKSESYAMDICRQRNRAYKAAGNVRDCAVMIDGPNDGYCVVDLRFAVANEFLYRIYR